MDFCSCRSGGGGRGVSINNTARVRRRRGARAALGAAARDGARRRGAAGQVGPAGPARAGAARRGVAGFVAAEGVAPEPPPAWCHAAPATGAAKTARQSAPPTSRRRRPSARAPRRRRATSPPRGAARRRRRALSARLDAATVGLCLTMVVVTMMRRSPRRRCWRRRGPARRGALLVSRARGERRAPSRVEVAWLETLRAEVALLEYYRTIELDLSSRSCVGCICEKPWTT